MSDQSRVFIRPSEANQADGFAEQMYAMVLALRLDTCCCALGCRLFGWPVFAGWALACTLEAADWDPNFLSPGDDQPCAGNPPHGRTASLHGGATELMARGWTANDVAERPPNPLTAAACMGQRARTRALVLVLPYVQPCHPTGRFRTPWQRGADAMHTDGRGETLPRARMRISDRG